MAVDRDKILQAAQKLVDRKKYDKALVEYRKLIDDDPNDVRTLLKVGDLHLKTESWEEAIAVYERVGEHYYREGFSVKAIAVYKQIRGIIRRHAQHLETRYTHIVPRLAEIYTQLGLTSDALAAYDEVASRLRQEGRERDALDIFKKVVELDPQNPIAHLRVADSRARLGEIDKAVERFGEAAEIMIRLGRRDDALKVLERLLEYRPEPSYARLAGRLYLERGAANDGMAALTKLQIAFKANPKDMETLEALATAFDAINQPKKAVEVLKESARVAREKGDLQHFDGLLRTLLERAGDDPAVAQLRSWRRQDEQDAEIEIVPDQEVLLEESIESIDEVFELEEGDLQPVKIEMADTAMLQLGEVDSDESSGVRRLLTEAERQRLVGHLSQAIQLLRDGLRNLGGSSALRHRLSDLLLEAGDQMGCILEKLILAQELANKGQIEPALEMLDEVLLLQPGQPDALQMRANLGFPPSPDMIGEQGIDDLQLDAPLMSYDVESGGVEEVLHRTRHHSAPSVALDDPFASGEASIPPHMAAAPPMAQRLAPPPRKIDENALDEAEALAEQGRFDEARELLHAELQYLPNHPIILELLADLDALASGRHSYSGPYPAPHAPPSSQGLPIAPPSQPIPLRPSEPPPLPYTAEPVPPPRREFASELAPVMEQVRAGVAAQVEVGDSATHYDLGVAYNEMGLHSDAISELTLAARDPNRECVCLSLIASIQLQIGETDKALDALHRALATQVKTRDQELRVAYEIANTYELKSMSEQALRHFERLAKLDPNYDDVRGSVSERVTRLRTESGARPGPMAPAPTAESGSLDDAFDDLFGEETGKKTGKK